jgi:NTE family protein
MDFDRKSTSPTIAIAFGGGGARGLAHIHVIEALDELGVRPTRITGSSIGAIMGAGMAAGMSGREIREFALNTVGQPREVVNRIWSLRPTNLQQMVSGGFRLGQYNLERILKAFLPDALPEDFADLQIPFGAVATDYYGESELLIEKGALYPALAASAAIPAVFMPVMLEGRIMVDGGIFNPVPFEYLFDDADIVIGVDVVGAPAGEDQQMPRRIESLFGSSQLMMQSIIAAKLRIRKPDILLRPNVGKIAVLDFMKAADILEMSAAVKDELKHALDAAIAFRA